jgi:hypothetical protein
MEKICRALERDAKLREEATPGPMEWADEIDGAYGTPDLDPTEYEPPQVNPPNREDEPVCWLSPHFPQATKANAALIAQAFTVDLGSCLRIAVEALAEIIDSPPSALKHGPAQATCEHPACEALAQIAALLPDDPEEK